MVAQLIHGQVGPLATVPIVVYDSVSVWTLAFVCILFVVYNSVRRDGRCDGVERYRYCPRTIQIRCGCDGDHWNCLNSRGYGISASPHVRVCCCNNPLLNRFPLTVDIVVYDLCDARVVL